MSERLAKYREQVSVLLRAAHALASGLPQVMREASALGRARDAETMEWGSEVAELVEGRLRVLANALDGVSPVHAPALPGGRVAFLPLTLDKPKVCGACGWPGPAAFLGEVLWARFDLSADAVNAGKWDFQAVVYVPLHEHLCGDTAGGLEALKRLGVLLSNPKGWGLKVTVTHHVPHAPRGRHD